MLCPLLQVSTRHPGWPRGPRSGSGVPGPRGWLRTRPVSIGRPPAGRWAQAGTARDTPPLLTPWGTPGKLDRHCPQLHRRGAQPVSEGGAGCGPPPSLHPPCCRGTLRRTRPIPLPPSGLLNPKLIPGTVAVASRAPDTPMRELFTPWEPGLPVTESSHDTPQGQSATPRTSSRPRSPSQKRRRARGRGGPGATGWAPPPALPGEQMARGCEVPGSWRSAHLFPLGDANCHPPGQPPRICMQAHTQDSGWPAPSNAAGLLTSQPGPGHRGASGDLPAWASPASLGLTARGDVGGLRGLASVPSVSIPPWPCVHPPRERTGDRPVRIARLPSLDWPPGLPEGPPPHTHPQRKRGASAVAVGPRGGCDCGHRADAQGPRLLSLEVKAPRCWQYVPW